MIFLVPNWETLKHNGAVLPQPTLTAKFTYDFYDHGEFFITKVPMLHGVIVPQKYSKVVMAGTFDFVGLRVCLVVKNSVMHIDVRGCYKAFHRYSVGCLVLRGLGSERRL